MKSIVAQAAIAAMRPIDRQFARLTHFELGWLREQRVFYDSAKPLSVPMVAALVAHIADQLHVRAPEIRLTRRANPYCMPWGKVKTIYLRPDHRQPYLIAHEVAHAATGTTRHPANFLEHYLVALGVLGGYEPALRKRMRAYGINI